MVGKIIEIKFEYRQKLYLANIYWFQKDLQLILNQKADTMLCTNPDF